ncbi:unnamed protein product [Cunninghamella blakesleeana]
MKELTTPLETPSGEQITNKPQRRSANPSERNRVFFWQNAPVRPKSSNNSNSLIIKEELNSTTIDNCILDSTKHTYNKNDNNEGQKKSPLSASSKDNSIDDSTGQLAMDANGQYRYLGKSSGFYLLQKSRTYHHGAFHFSGNNNNKDKTITIAPFHSPHTMSHMNRSSSSSVSSVSSFVDPNELPPSDLSTTLVRAYFKYFYPFLPIFYKQQLSSSLDDPAEPISPLLLNAIYALASRVIDDDIRVRSDPNQPETAGDPFFERAKFLLDSYYDIPKISTVQALLLLSSHQQGMRKSARAWLYSGMAFRMALDLGLNRNCDHWQIPYDEKERRKRVFWCCFVADRMASATFGRTSCFEESDCDVPFPNIEDDNPVYIASNPSSMNYTPPGPLKVLNHLVKVCDILGHVLKNIYYTKALQQADMRHIDQLVHTLTGRLTHWHNNLPASLCIDIKNIDHLVYPISVYQLHLVYHTTVILLHRLFIPNNANDSSTSSMTDYNICVESATCIMNIAHSMLQKNILKYISNTSVYCVFTSGIIFINSATSKNDPGKSFDAKLSINKIMHILNKMGDTWPSALRSAGILGELAGIHDLNLPTSENTLRPIVNSSTPSSPSITSKNASDYNKFTPRNLDISKGNNYWTQDSAVRSSSSPLTPSKDASDFQNINNNQLDSSNNNNNNGNINNLRLSTPPQSIQSPPVLQQTYTKGNMDPFAAPDTIPVPSQRQFDPLSAAFWGVPQSLDLNEWNNYLGSQLPNYSQQQQQQQQQQSDNYQMGSSSSPASSSNGEQLIPTRNVINFGNNVSLKPSTSSSPIPSTTTSSSITAVASASNNYNSILQSDISGMSSYNRSPTTIGSSSMSVNNGSSLINSRYPPQHLIHGDSNVDILSGVSIPLDIPNVPPASTSESVLFGFLSDKSSGIPNQSNTPSSPSSSSHNMSHNNNNTLSHSNLQNNDSSNNDSTFFSGIIY